MLLDAAGAALPGRLGPSQRGPETEVRVAALELLKLRAIQKPTLIAHTEDQLDFVGAVVSEARLEHAAEGRDTGSSGHQH